MCAMRHAASDTMRQAVASGGGGSGRGDDSKGQTASVMVKFMLKKKKPRPGHGSGSAGRGGWLHCRLPWAGGDLRFGFKFNSQQRAVLCLSLSL